MSARPVPKLDLSCLGITPNPQAGRALKLLAPKTNLQSNVSPPENDSNNQRNPYAASKALPRKEPTVNLAPTYHKSHQSHENHARSDSVNGQSRLQHSAQRPKEYSQHPPHDKVTVANKQLQGNSLHLNQEQSELSVRKSATPAPKLRLKRNDTKTCDAGNHDPPPKQILREPQTKLQHPRHQRMFGHHTVLESNSEKLDSYRPCLKACSQEVETTRGRIFGHDTDNENMNFDQPIRNNLSRTKLRPTKDKGLAAFPDAPRVRAYHTPAYNAHRSGYVKIPQRMQLRSAKTSQRPLSPGAVDEQFRFYSRRVANAKSCIDNRPPKSISAAAFSKKKEKGQKSRLPNRNKDQRSLSKQQVLISKTAKVNPTKLQEEIVQYSSRSPDDVAVDSKNQEQINTDFKSMWQSNNVPSKDLNRTKRLNDPHASSTQAISIHDMWRSGTTNSSLLATKRVRPTENQSTLSPASYQSTRGGNGKEGSDHDDGNWVGCRESPQHDSDDNAFTHNNLSDTICSNSHSDCDDDDRVTTDGNIFSNDPKTTKSSAPEVSNVKTIRSLWARHDDDSSDTSNEEDIVANLDNDESFLSCENSLEGSEQKDDKEEVSRSRHRHVRKETGLSILSKGNDPRAMWKKAARKAVTLSTSLAKFSRQLDERLTQIAQSGALVQQNQQNPVCSLEDDDDRIQDVLCAVTHEILEEALVTDEAIEKVFLRHLSDHKDLDQSALIEALRGLAVKLDVSFPEDIESEKESPIIPKNTDVALNNNTKEADSNT